MNEDDSEIISNIVEEIGVIRKENLKTVFHCDKYFLIFQDQFFFIRRRTEVRLNSLGSFIFINS